MSDALTAALAVLAVYRVSTDIAWRAGPFGAHEDIRNAMDYLLTRIGQQTAWQRALTTTIAGIHCPHCIAFWLALVPALALDGGGLLWLGIAGGASLLIEIGERK